MKIVVAPLKAARCKSFESAADMETWLLSQKGEHAVIINGEVLGVARSSNRYFAEGANKGLDFSEIEDKFSRVAIVAH